MFRKPRLTSAAAVRLSAIVLLILIENVARIDGYAASPLADSAAAVVDAGAGAAAAAAAAESALYDTHRLAKRMDLESCLGQFDVHKNTIIRTGESQAIGGKYLQGFQLDTMEECQRLCCETESCDVYIFEDKNDGYCYLFECGPPENFHCKFTRHANYTSSVLTSVRHVVEATTQRPSLPQIGSANISQQEWELTSLKVKPEARDKSGDGVGGGSSAAAAGGGGGSVAQADMFFPQKAANTTAHCGRFQFTCHSGECIAVYNACDGIPQCEDGSDEGPECSGAATSSISVLSPKPNAEPAANVVEPIVQKAAVLPQYQSPLQQQLQSVQQQQQQQQQQALINNREDAAAWANRKVVADTLQTDLGNSATDSNGRNIFSHKGGLQLTTNNNNNNNAGVSSYPNVAGPNLGMYGNLQRNGIYLPQAAPEMQMPSGGVYAPTQQQQQFLTPQGHILVPNINWQQQPLPPQQQSVATPISTVGLQQAQGPAYMLNAPPPPQQQPQTPQLQPPQIKTISADTNDGLPQAVPAAGIAAAAPQTAAGSKTNKTGAKTAALPKSAAEAPAADEYDEDYEEKSTEAPKKKQRKHKKVKSKTSDEPTQTLPDAVAAAAATPHKDPIELALEQQQQQQQQKPKQPSAPAHDDYKTLHEQLALEFRDHDGQSERPGGAVLSLTLGLLVTAALAILIGCRMRTVGRRARRLGGKTPYSHEADFLVNGMYL